MQNNDIKMVDIINIRTCASIVFLSTQYELLGFDSEEYKQFNCDLSSVADKEEFLRKVSTAMQFPSYFGVNWDALDECLIDMSWLPAKGYVLFIHNSRKAWAENPMLMGNLINSWLDAADSWEKESIIFKLVFV